MTPAVDDVKQALLHPNPIVRDAALKYFGLAYSLDPDIWPLAVQAIEKYGWEEAFASYELLHNLRQSDQTLQWLIDTLNNSIEISLSFVDTINSIIESADAELLGRHKAQLMECEELYAEESEAITDKLELLSTSSDDCWKELERVCDRIMSDDVDDVDLRHASRLGEAISREGERQADRVLTILSPRLETSDDDPLLWMEVTAAEIAGRIRLESSVPLLAAKLIADDSDFMSEECSYALTKIGSDSAVDAIVKGFHEAPANYALYAASALKEMRGEKVVVSAMELLKSQTDPDIQVILVETALANFDPRGLHAAKELKLDDRLELRPGMVATALLSGEDFPDLGKWLEEERERRADIQRQREWTTKSIAPYASSSTTPIFDGPVAQPVRSVVKKVGRNEPCPCGSGKKYKKCCLDK